MRSITQLGWFVPMLAAAALGVACSSGSTPPPNSAADPAPEPGASAAAEATPETGAAEEAPDPSISEYEAATAEGAAGEPEPPAGSKLSDGEERTMKVIQKTVLDNRARFRACYDAVQEKEPEVQGDMTIYFVLDSGGRVREAALNEQRSTLKHPEIAKCIVDELRKVQFAASTKGLETKVNYPFNFNPK